MKNHVMFITAYCDNSSEAELHQLRNLLITNSSPDVICAFDTGRQIYYASGAAITVWGYDLLN
jgi:hypothetical protein